MRRLLTALPMLALAVLPACGAVAHVQNTGSSELDVKVRAFLDQHRGTWRDLNVPESDGRLLYDLVLKNGFRRALEIGTSTGHSAVWIAWALSKTGGRLTTIEIDPARHREALANFREAGLSEYIDARLGDAHRMVPTLEGPFDFVFSDADKEWYTNYFRAVWPKVVPGGCFTAHNVGSARQSGPRVPATPEDRSRRPHDDRPIEPRGRVDYLQDLVASTFGGRDIRERRHGCPCPHTPVPPAHTDVVATPSRTG